MLVQGKIYTLWAPRGNMGSTLSAITIAKKLSKSKGKTLLVDLNFMQPRLAAYLNLNDATKSLDNLYPYASGGSLSGDIIEGNCEKVDDLYVLRGTLNPSLMNEFPKKEIIETIVRTMKDHFTHIIIDVYSNINNPGTYFGLKYADKVFVPMERDVISILALHELRDILKGIYGVEKFELLFCQDKENNHMPIKDIESSLGMVSAGIFPYVRDFQNHINKGEVLKIDKDRTFKSYLVAVDEFISSKIGNFDEDSTKKKGLRERLFKK